MSHVLKKTDSAANELGVSRSTVSRALNGSCPVNPETRRRIFDYIQKDSPVPAAKSGGDARFTIGIGLPNRPTFFWDVALSGIRATACELPKGLVSLRLIRFSGDVRGEEETLHVIDMLEQVGADAYMLVPYSSGPVKERLEKLAQKALVAVFNDSIEFDGRFLYAGPDHWQEGKRAAEILLAETAATRKILMISPPLEQESVRQRIDGFRKGIGPDAFSEIVGHIEESSYNKLTPSILARRMSQTADGRFNCIYVADGATQLVGSALIKLGLLKNVFCVGHEFSQQSEKQFLSGMSGACIIQDIYLQSTVTLKSLIARLNGESGRFGDSIFTGFTTKVFRHD